MFHFSSFDESWKVRVEGELGARWGIWDKDEKLKYISKMSYRDEDYHLYEGVNFREHSAD